MMVALAPHPAQIQYWAQSALNGFETLDHWDAVENAKDDLRSILEYVAALDRADYAVPILGIETIKAGVGLELVSGEGRASNPADL
jgi:hypothetical protein